jgi:peroxiredoxin
MFRILVGVFALLPGAAGYSQTPAIGTKAPDFTLSTPLGKSVQLSKEQHGNALVLIILRGFPGYQCPYCQKQLHDFAVHASEFAARKTSVLLVYPGPPASLDQHANEFLAKESELPANIALVTDPDYEVTNLNGLRWNAANETAYPSTFILDKEGHVLFEKISHDHGDRMSAQDALNHLPMK